MIGFPNAAATARLVASPWIILPPVLCYLGLLAPNVLEFLSVFAAPSPQTLAAVMAKPWAASLFWAYAGAFDLFVGRWMFLDARQSGIRHWVLGPLLFICIFSGPLGFALYGVAKVCHRRF